jgi:cytochrome c553
LVVGSAAASLFGSGPTWDYTTGKIAAYTTQTSNLVSSPIAGACTSCHDDVAALNHITTSGFGSFYAPRGAAVPLTAGTALATKEQCLVCHGPGKILPIKAVHNPNWDFTTTPVTSPW